MVKHRQAVVGFRSVALILALAAAGPAFAQEADEGDDTIVVTGYVTTETSAGTKGGAPLIEIPQSISVISRDRIELLGLGKVEQAVRYVSGVVGEGFGPDERGSSLRVRAFTPDQYVDGVLSPVTSARNTNLDLYLVDRVEILKGPVSSLYGAAPPGGIYMLTTRRPTKDFEAEVRLTTGTQQLLQGGATIAGPLTSDGVVTARVTVTGYDRDHMVDYAYSKRHAFQGAINFELSSRTNLLLTGLYQKDEIRGSLQFLPYSGTVAPNPNGVIPRTRMSGEPFGGNFNNQFDVGYEVDHEFSDNLTLSQVLRYGERQEQTISVYGSGYTPGSNRRINRVAFDQDLRPHRLAVDTRLNWKQDTGPLSHDLIVGVDLFRFIYKYETGSRTLVNNLDIFDPVYPGESAILRPVLTNQQHWKSLQTGLYVQDRIKVGNVVLTGGLRHDIVDGTSRDRLTNVVREEDNKAWSWRLGANYVFENGLAPYVGVSRSFQTAFGVSATGEQFTPVYTRQVEAGLKYDAVGLPGDGRLFLAAAVYQYDITGLVTGDPDNPGFSIQTGETRMRGFEIEGVTKLTNGLSVNAAFTYSDPRVRSNGNAALIGKRITATPEYMGSAFIDYTWPSGPLEGFGFGGGVRYVGKKFGDSMNIYPVPSVTLFDAVVHYNKNDWGFYINASNLFDKDYVAVCTSASGCSYGNERVVTVSLSRKFR